MNPVLKALFRMRGARAARQWDQSAAHPRETQAELLIRIVRANSHTEYGRAFGFRDVSSVKAFQRSTPIVGYPDLEPYVERMLQGAPRVLTGEPPIMFCLTSGTTDRPKHVPLTRAGLTHARHVSSQWLYRALLSHPFFLERSVLCVTGSASEGRAPCGLPCGSVSGAIHRAIPAPVRRLFALPAVLADIEDYAVRYHLSARFALEQDIGFATTPNPTTLSAIAEAGVRGQEEIIRAIRDGVPVSEGAFALSARAAEQVAQCARGLNPNPGRARQLETVLARHGALIPRHCWNTRLIGCWLGGSVGFHAEKLADIYAPDTPVRDLGYLASEGSFTLPVSDGIAAGIPYVHGHVFEFVPESREHIEPDSPTLLCHELEEGARYRILITNWNGLYRYDIGDIVEAQGRYRNTPLLAFLRKERDGLNITGEKLHVNHLILALRALRNAQGERVAHVRAVPDLERVGYDILALFDPEPDRDRLRQIWLPCLDTTLQKVNIEYAAKRKSGRLRPPRLRLMDPDWPTAVRAQALAEGRRDIQFKWRTMETALSEIDRAHIRETIDMETHA